jgi:ABC-type microcin C transport system duplicated ATPase subunit YejF
LFEENKYNKQYCISVFDLRQTYGSFSAIDGISFNLEYGKVFGFLGPNGAGKTTTKNTDYSHSALFWYSQNLCSFYSFFLGNGLVFAIA